MSGIFLKLLNLSISASWLVLVVLALRLVLKRAPKWVNVLLWGMVALRLMLPFSIESALSLIPSAETLSPEVVQFDPAPTITSGVEFIDNAVNPSLSESFAAAPLASVNPLYVWTYLAGWVWLIGLAAMLLYALVSYLRLRRCVRASIPLRENIYVCDEVPSPFILGIVHPRIYLPSALDEAQRGSVLSHERAHLARRDHWWKPLGFALLAVYWFNPVLWLAYALLCRDIELACDERVIRTMDESAVKTYSTVLLACSMPRKAVITCPLAFGEVSVKERVKRVLEKKPAKALIALALAVCLVIGVCFLTAKQDEQIYGLSAGSYVMDEADAVQILPSRVTFRMSGNRHEFVFMLSPISSYYMAGDYTINDGFVTCSDGTYTLVFKIQDNDTIVLQIPNQDGLHMSGLFIPNGTEFHYEAPSRGTLTFHAEPASANAMRADFRLDFGKALDYGEVWAECWQDGACTKSEPLVLNREDEQLHLSFQVQGSEAQNAPAVQVSMQSGASDAVLTRFALPDTMLGFGFKSYEDGTELPLQDGEDVVLASLVPDLGDGVRMYSCTELAAMPELYQEADSILIVKAAFGSGLPPQ